MGRTVMPYSHVMEDERARLNRFRRALSKEDQQAFDRLFDRAKMHTSAGVYMANPWPMEPILLSICLEQGKIIGHFSGRLEYGPRSLGSRSILGDARNQNMQADLNLKIKYRESFRPIPRALSRTMSVAG